MKKVRRLSRHARIRAKITGTTEVPRLAVFRSNRFLWAQLIDDTAGRTLVAVSDREIAGKSAKATKSDRAAKAGELLAKKAKEAGIKKIKFDRGGFQYQGRIKAFADAARKGGLKF